MEVPWSDYIATPPSFASSSQFGYSSEYCSVPVPPPDFSSCFPSLSQDPAIDPPDYPWRGPPQLPSPAIDFNEIENRTLLVSNLEPDTQLEEIERVFKAAGAVRTIDSSTLENGSVSIEYFDLRHANQMRTTPVLVNGAAVSLSYAPLPRIDDPRNPPNNGTIVVFHLPAGITNQQIEATFGPFGEIRQVRGTPSKPNQKFVEYWDIRDAQKALDALNGQYLMGSRVSIEFSLPGGFRRNVQQPAGRPRL
jgi:RNA recognition motif-containing protein